MDNNLSELENNILKARQVDGLNVNETLELLNITKYAYQKSISNIKKLNLYDEEKIKKAKKNREQRDRYKKNKSNSKPKLSEEESLYRKKCIDLLSEKCFNYKVTHRFNPTLITKIQNLHSINSYKIIFNTINLHEKNLEYANTKTFPSEIAKINYIISIIKNNLNSTLRKMQQQDKIRRGIMKSNRDERIVEELNRDIKMPKSDKVDLSFLLDEDDF